MLKSNFCYHILLFKIFVEIDSKSIQVCNLLIINGSSEMTPEIQTILNLLCGSAVCCKEEVTPVDGHVGNHVVSVTHPDGRVTSVIVSGVTISVKYFRICIYSKRVSALFFPCVL